MTRRFAHRYLVALPFSLLLVLASAGAEAAALNARSNLGPSVAVIADHTYLLHVGHDNDYIWEVRGSGTWPTGWEKRRVHDADERSWAFSTDEPVTVALDDRLYLFYRGHNNDRVWFTRKRVRYDRSVTPWRLNEGAWDSPGFIPGVETAVSPAIAVHGWRESAPSLNVAVTGRDERIYLWRASPWANPDNVFWRRVPSPPSVTTSHAPAVISFQGKLHLFYVDNYGIWMVRADSNDRHEPRWSARQAISELKWVDQTPTVFEHDSALYLMYAGHGNTHLWIARSADGLNWQELGYVDHVSTDRRPSLTRSGSSLILAFRPLFSDQLAFGTLTIDDSNESATHGHVWQSRRYERELQPRLVSDLLLARRWPNGVVPFKFASSVGTPNSGGANYAILKDKARAAMFGTTSSSLSVDCSAATPCVGWAAAETIRFVECPSGSTPCGDYGRYVYIRISDDKDYSNATYNKRGYSDLKSEERRGGCALLSVKDCRRGPCDWDSGERCVFDVWLRIVDNTIKFMWNSGHEFGHMLGFNHEQFRPDRADHIDMSDCSPANRYLYNRTYLLTDAHFIGNYDVRSIMHYVENHDPMAKPAFESHAGRCWTSKPGAPIGGWRNTDVPTARDLAKLQLMYGVRGDWVLNHEPGWCIGGGREVHVGDFDGDDRQDLLCHSTVSGVHATGRRWLDFADVDGHFDGSDWDSGLEQFCWGSSRRLLVGNFDGLRGDDALCHKSGLGTVSIDYTNDDGELNGREWPQSGAQPWPCSGVHSRVHVGNFDGHEGDDLLCHDRDTGSRWIDWADQNGRFRGPDWSSEEVGARDWCSGASERLIIGNFNGDSRDDALCHDTRTGHRKIDYASRDGDLKGTNWGSLDSGAAAFCNGSNERLYAADVDGDGADDLLCHDRRTGMVTIDIATPEVGAERGSGLLGEDFHRDLAFCNAQDAQLVIGRFDGGDSRDDLLCHNRVTGHKAILYAREGGSFRVPPGF